MFRNQISRWMIRAGIGTALLFLIPLVMHSRASLQEGAIALVAPPFLSSAHAQAPETITGLEEAGISAYFDRGASINLNQVRGLLVVELETSEYIIGSIDPDDPAALNPYPESENPHMFVSTSGWVMAYYHNNDPVAKIADTYNYGGATINTKLEMALGRISSAIGNGSNFTATFYDFRYPNATHLLFVADTTSSTDSFTIQLPGTFDFDEKSWTLGTESEYSTISLNGEVIGQATPAFKNIYGSLTLGPDLTHTIEVTDGTWGDYTTGMIALVYRELP